MHMLVKKITRLKNSYTQKILIYKYGSLHSQNRTSSASSRIISYRRSDTPHMSLSLYIQKIHWAYLCSVLYAAIWRRFLLRRDETKHKRTKHARIPYIGTKVILNTAKGHQNKCELPHLVISVQTVRTCVVACLTLKI